MGMSIKHRPVSLVRQFILPRLLLGVGVILIGGVFTSTPVMAKESVGLKQLGTVTSLNKNEDKLKDLEKTALKKQETVEQKEVKLAKLKADAEDAKKKTEDIDKQLEELQERVTWLGDMFVRPVKYSASSAGNSYALGNCTWYVKQMRPDLGNFYGNAGNWIGSANSDGFATGSKPKVHAVGVTTAGWAGHVVYVERVSLDGSTVSISEMNYGGLYQMNWRTVPASEFRYIYEKT